MSANTTGQQLAWNQETPVFAGEKEVWSHSKKRKDTVVAIILQRQNVSKPVEHGLLAGNRKNEKLQHTEQQGGGLTER